EGGMDASGHFAVWGGFNANKQNVNGTFTFNINGTWEDGSKLSAHSVEHFNTTPGGVEFFWTKCHSS
ncbi:MAG TPA: hypothetical protein VFY88_03090, partial [Intrasporangium sp.]|nr:hypothetical protein [Intrasporangium sp.]